jgi:hypothetical protein
MSDPGWLNDIVQLDTITNTITPLYPTGITPIARGYHSFTAAPGRGQYCYAIGGRSKNNKLLSGKDVVSIFDPVKCRWLNPPTIGGLEFDSRSSHRALAVDIRSEDGDIYGILVFGGAGSPGGNTTAIPGGGGGSGSKSFLPGSSSKASYRFKDLHFLQIPDRVNGTGAKPLRWVKCQIADCLGNDDKKKKNRLSFGNGGGGNARASLLQVTTTNNNHSAFNRKASINNNNNHHDYIGPSARSAHTMEIVGGQVYVIAGYGDGKQYVPDAWCIAIQDASIISLEDHNNNSNSSKRRTVEPHTSEPVEGDVVLPVKAVDNKRKLRTADDVIEDDDADHDNGGDINHDHHQPEQQQWRTTNRSTRGGGTAPADVMAAAGVAGSIGGGGTRKKKKTAAGTRREEEGLLTAAMLQRMRNATVAPPPLEDLKRDVEQAQDRIAALQAQLQQSTRLVGTLRADKGQLENELANADTKWRTAVRDAMEWKEVADQARKETRLLQSKARQEAAEEMQHIVLDLKRKNDMLTMTGQTRDALLRENVGNLEAKNIELAQVKIEAKRLLDYANRRNEEYSKQINTLREQAKVHNDRTQTDLKKIENLEKQLEKARATNASIRRDHAEERSKLKSEHSKEKLRADNLEIELEELKRNVHRTKQEHATAKRKLEGAVTEIAEAQGLVEKLRDERGRMEEELQQVTGVASVLKRFQMSDRQDIKSGLERLAAGAQLFTKVLNRHEAGDNGNGGVGGGGGGRGGGEGGAGTSAAAAKR